MPPPNPTVIAYHLVWTAYGAWLPNDPRGSGSKATATKSLAELGPVHFGRRAIQPDHNTVHKFKQNAADRLKFPIVRHTPQQIHIVAGSFATTIATHRYTCYACAILLDHVHLVIRKHRHSAETMIRNLQDAARDLLRASDEKLANHPIWTGGGWRGFLDKPREVRRAIAYVQANPNKSRIARQAWPFVTEYEAGRFTSGRSLSQRKACWVCRARMSNCWRFSPRCRTAYADAPPAPGPPRPLAP